MGRAVLLVLVVALGGAFYVLGPIYTPELTAWFTGAEPVMEPSPELAEATLDRFERFRAGETGDELRLGSAELSSVMQYSFPGILPEGVRHPSVALHAGRITLSARVTTAAFPEMRSLRDVVGFLPDTVDIEMKGTLLPFDENEAALHVDRVHAMRIPLPERFLPEILRAVGREDREGLPPNAMLVRLPEGLRSVHVLRDSLVLVAER